MIPVSFPRSSGWPGSSLVAAGRLRAWIQSTGSAVWGRSARTHDAGGPALGIVAGVGATPGQALAELRGEAESFLQREAAADLEAADKEWEEDMETWLAPLGPDPLRPRDERPRRVAARPHPGQRPSDTEPEQRQFEVVDVRLTPGVMEGGGDGWLAYATLVNVQLARATNGQSRLRGTYVGDSSAIDQQYERHRRSHTIGQAQPWRSVSRWNTADRHQAARRPKALHPDPGDRHSYHPGRAGQDHRAISHGEGRSTTLLRSNRVSRSAVLTAVRPTPSKLVI
jgi:hypothetical protein